VNPSNPSILAARTKACPAAPGMEVVFALVSTARFGSDTVHTAPSPTLLFHALTKSFQSGSPLRGNSLNPSLPLLPLGASASVSDFLPRCSIPQTTPELEGAQFFHPPLVVVFEITPLFRSVGFWIFFIFLKGAPPLFCRARNRLPGNVDILFVNCVCLPSFHFLLFSERSTSKPFFVGRGLLPWTTGSLVQHLD